MPLSRLAPQLVPDHYSDLQDFYRRLTADASIHLPLWLPGTRSLREANQQAQRVMAEAADLRAGQSLLDAGCGLGGTAIWLAQQHGVRVLGVSNSESNIRACRALAAERGVAALALFESADLMADFAARESMDCVWNLESLNYLAPKRDFLERVFRFLKPGGVWLCMDRYLDGSLLSPAQPEYRTLTSGFYTPAHWESQDTLLKSMAACGFADTSFRDFTSAVLATPRERRVEIAAGVRAILGALQNPRSFRAMLRAFRVVRASYSLMEQGVMAYGLLIGRKPGA